MFTNQKQNIPTSTTTNPKNKKIIKFRKFPFSTTKILRKNLILKERKIKNKKNYFLKEERKEILEKLRKMVGEKIGCGQLQIVNVNFDFNLQLFCKILNYFFHFQNQY